MCVTYAVVTTDRIIRAGKSLQPIGPEHARGLLEMYVCRHCGFVEWYCLDPARLPIGPQYMTEIVEYESQERPFR
jgi:hypothetical protein